MQSTGVHIGVCGDAQLAYVPSMAQTTVHVTGQGHASFSLSAPDRASAADVLAAFTRHAAGDSVGAWAVRSDGEHSRPTSETWRQWCSQHPATVVSRPSQLDVRARLTGVQPAATIVAGPDAGFSFALPPHTVTVGRSERADFCLQDPFASRTPQQLRFGTNTVGSSVVVVDDGQPETVNSTAVPWPKPPRVAQLNRPSILHLVIPLVIGIALAMAMQVWWFLAFSLSGPLSAGLQLLTERRRIRRQSAEGLRSYAASLRTLAETVEQRAAEAKIPPSRDRLTVCIGYGTVLLPAAVAEPPEPDESWDDDYRAACQTLEGRTVLPIDAASRRIQTQAPINVDLRDHSVVLCGAEAVPIVRALCAPLSAAAIVVHGRAAARRTPELLTALPVCPCVYGDNCVDSEAAVTITVDHDRIAVAGADAKKPVVVEASARNARIVQAASSSATMPEPGAINPARMSTGRFLSLCPHTSGTDEAWSEPVSFDELASQCTRAEVPIGLGPDGPVSADLFADGPHALVAGTTGSGKSVLLQTWIAALCRSRRPDELRLILMDFKGGAAFSSLAELPHVESCSDNLDLRSALRTLRSVQAEVRYREGVLKASGCPDIDAHNQTEAGPLLPRIVVVIDEFQVLTADFPPGVEALESLTALGRSLGIHIVLATQKPSGVITSRMRTNIALRICMRVRDASDSLEVLDSPVAADFPPDRPGMGCISTGHRSDMFRAASLDIPADASAQLSWRRLDTGEREPGSASGACSIEVEAPPVPILQQLLQTARPKNTRRITPETLPEVLPLNGSGPVGLIDLPDQQTVVDWTPQADLSTAIVGGPRTGKSSLLWLLARVFSEVSKASRGNARAQSPDSVLFTRDGPSCCRSGLLVVNHADAWLVEYALGRMEQKVAPGGRPRVFIDDFEHLTSQPHVLMRLEALLSDTSAVIVCDRRTLSSKVGASISRRVFFPPASDGDTVFLGLSNHRFDGFPPAGRAVLIGPHTDCGGAGADEGLVQWDADVIGPDGVDVQVAYTEGTAGAADTGVGSMNTPDAFADPAPPLPWGIRHAPTPGVLGYDPCGKPVVWDTNEHGHVLSIIGPAEVRQSIAATLTAAELPDCFTQLSAADALPGDIAPAMTAKRAVLGWGLHEQLPYGSPAAQASALGPRIIVGARAQAELENFGLRHVPVAPPGIAWFITRTAAIPIQLQEGAPL